MNIKSILKSITVFFVGLSTSLFLSCFSQEPSPVIQDFNPKPASASVYNLGLKSYEQGDIESAITFFKRAVDLDPNFVDAYYNLGAIYKKKGDLGLAINAFQKAVELNPSDFEATYELANCYLSTKDYGQAKKYFSLIPENFSKYNEARRQLLSINRQSDEATILPQDSPASNGPPSAASLSLNQGQLLIDTLTKVSSDSFKENFKIVSSKFNGPTGITKDSKGNLYVANFTKDAIERITPDADGQKEIFVSKLGLSGPVGLTIDENDNLYVANYNGDSIVKITQSKEIFVVVNNVIKPYYLFYDSSSRKLFATVQGNDSLLEIDTSNISKYPVTSR